MTRTMDAVAYTEVTEVEFCMAQQWLSLIESASCLAE
ncbi:hypothetical protein ACVWWU_000838 [Pantoea sp. PA1]|nr:hypothetical protein [Pantoea ananatis]MDR6088478.1 hypothetical protein [Pantoea ananatis]